MFARWFLLLGLCSTTGCATHAALARNTGRTAATLTELNYHQVLTNVAMFEADPWAVPSFATINAGTVTVADQKSLSGNAIYSPTLTFAQQGGGALPILTLTPAGAVQRQINENWSMIPVADTDNLQRLRCLFQLLVLGEDAPDYEEGWKRLRAYFRVSDERLARMIPRGWYGVGTCKKDIPRDACYVACHCGCGAPRYVWVTRDGLQGLARFTLRAMDLATGELHAPVKTIVKTLDKDGQVQSIQETTSRFDEESLEKDSGGVYVVPDRDRDTDTQRGNRGLYFVPR